MDIKQQEAKIAQSLLDDLSNLETGINNENNRTLTTQLLVKFAGEVVAGRDKEIAALKAELSDAVNCLEFYADPETYFAIGFFPDRPCGEFMADFSEDAILGFKPGKRARELFDKYAAKENS